MAMAQTRSTAPRRVLLWFVVAGVHGLALAGAAAGHTDTVSSAPRDGAELATAPPRVTVTYASPLGAAGSARVRVGGRDVAGPPRLAAADARRLIIPLRAGAAPPGAYAVSWTVVGADGHTLAGELAFRVRGPDGRTVLRAVGVALVRAGTAVAAGVAPAD